MRISINKSSLAARAGIALVVTTTLFLTACSSTPAKEPVPEVSAKTVSGELTIYAAASLTASFAELADEFTAENPGVTIAPISFDGSSTLATQLLEGAPADVFASADEANMQKVSDLIDGDATVFVSNVLQIAVEPGNPKNIKTLQDLSDPELRVVLCAPEVPCGTASHTLLGADKVAVTPVSEEQNVKAVLTKVQMGEADAGLVYVTDVAASAQSVDGVTIVGADRAKNSYPIASLKNAQNPETARAFVAFVLSVRGQEILANYGFSAP